MGCGREGLPAEIKWFVYLSHALSTWGDRMWAFGVGLFMVIIYPESLLLTAIYGLSMGCSVLLFGALVGDWIDKTPRLKAARTALIIQNTSVIVCACAVFTVVTLKTEIEAVWPHERLLTLCYIGIILIAILCTLGSMATNIAVQRDWIVEICGRDKNLLATMTATLRRIDLFNSLVAPIVTGQIMYFTSTGIGALFIAGWNLVSVFVEYILLWKVYSLVPALKSKKLKYRTSTQKQDNDETTQEMITIEGTSSRQHVQEVEGKFDDSSNEDKIVSDDIESSKGDKNVTDDIESSKGGKIFEEEPQKEGDVMIRSKTKKSDSVLMKMFSGFITLYRGWRIYMKYDVAFAGLGLAALYMTVLGFDNITVGFAYSQGINESTMGILMAAGAVFGILGTIVYPIVRRRIGLERTGLFGYFVLVSFLCLCVASIWAPGSPFDPLNIKSVPAQAENVINGSTYVNTLPNIVPSNSIQSLNAIEYNSNHNNNNTTESREITTFKDTQREITKSFISVGLLMAGIIGARCGLWMADLSITQLFLENIHENERGIVNGVQTSLNKLMDMLKFILVIAAPQDEVFGILVLISYAFIVIGWILYAKYSYGARGHLFHFDKLRKCDCSDARNNNTDMAVAEPESHVDLERSDPRSSDK
ncbi:hypothetical protein ACF0H5_015907 [Mactra antiquata]